MKLYEFDLIPHPIRILAIIVSSIIIALLDYITGPNVSFSLFYLVPLGLVTLGYGRRSGYVGSVVAAIIWIVVDVCSNKAEIETFIYVWNGLVRFGFFILSASLLAELNEKIDYQEMVEKVKAEFMATVSHELRTPLTSIKGALTLIQSGAVGELPDKVKAMLDIANRNSERLVLLISDILDIEKIQSGKLKFRMEPTDVDALIDEAIAANKGYGDEFGVTFVKMQSHQNALVLGDKNRLLQVLSNLMSNAAKFSLHGGVVKLSLSDQEKTFCVSVKDFGSGIPAEFRNQIFERFAQADSPDTRSKKGSGLGLSISKMIVEHHNGRVWFESEVGQGTTFYVDLPKLEK